MRRILFTIFLVVACATGTAADPIEDADFAYLHDDYALAERLYRPLAVQGIAHAQFWLGVMYRNGEGVPQDTQEGVNWTRKAAEQGYERAQNSLGLMYARGWGVPENQQEAVKWIRKAAEQGNFLAQSDMGWRYSYGRGVPKDEREGVKWFRKAAEQGDSSSQHFLGARYEMGWGFWGISKDFIRAHMWYSVAVAGMSGSAKKMVMKDRDHVASRMTAEQIEKAQEMARRCQETKFKECD